MNKVTEDKAFEELRKVLPELKSFHRVLILAVFKKNFAMTSDWELSINGSAAEFDINWL